MNENTYDDDEIYKDRINVDDDDSFMDETNTGDE